MSAIPSSTDIDVLDAPKITPIEFLRQIINNIQAQIGSIDYEFEIASQSNNPEVYIFYYRIFNICLFLYNINHIRMNIAKTKIAIMHLN